MSDPYPNESASSIYTHLRTLSNTIVDLGDIVSSYQFSATLSELADPSMPSSSATGSLRRRFLRIISFGRYSSHSADDTEPLNKTHDAGRRHSAPPNLNINGNGTFADRPVSATARNSSQSSDSAQTTIHHEVSPTAVPFLEAFRAQHPDHYAIAPDFDTTTETETETETDAETERVQGPRNLSPRTLTRISGRRYTIDRLDAARIGHIHCDNCGGYWEYNHIYCPRCAGRTLRHDHGTGGHGPAATNDAEAGAGAWDNDAEGPVTGTVEESWATTTTSATGTLTSSDVPASSRIPREPTTTSGAEPPSAADPSLARLNWTSYVSCHGRPCIRMVACCCCGDPSTHDIAPAGYRLLSPTVGNQPCCLGWFPFSATAICGGPPTCACTESTRFSRCLHRSEPRWVGHDGVGEQDEHEREGNAICEKIGWLGRMLRWFCCY